MTNYEHKIYSTVTVNAKGQIVIPAEARDRLNIKPGDQLLVTSKGEFVIGLIKADNIQDFVTIIEKDASGFFSCDRDDIGKLRRHQ